MWSAEELRRGALDALGPQGDERAREALRRGSLEIVRGVAHWEGSGGPVEAHRVRLGVDAKMLGSLRAAPAVTDALCAAVAATVSGHRGEALLELVAHWTPGARSAAAGYRDAAPPEPEESLRDALLEYLEGAGEPSFALALGAVDIDTSSPGRLEVRLASSADKRAFPIVTAALRDLTHADVRVL